MGNNLNLSHNIPDFKTLADNIRQLHNEAQSRALNAVNKMATLRNWLVGKLFSYLLQLPDKKVLEDFFD